MASWGFRTISRGTWPPDRAPAKTVYLQRDNWDDFRYRTTFTMFVAVVAGPVTRIGVTKVCQVGMQVPAGGTTPLETDLAARFSDVPADTVSLGQGSDFYTSLIDTVGLEDARRILTALHDLSILPSSIEDLLARSEPVRRSLFRSLSIQNVTDQFSRIIGGGPSKTAFSLRYFPDPGTGSDGDHMVFTAETDGLLPKNLHAVIGSNGAGKTTTLHRIEDGLRQQRIENTAGPHLEIAGAERISSLLTVSFSAFDDRPAAEVDAPEFRVVQVGLSEQEPRADDWSPLAEGEETTGMGQAARFLKNVQLCRVDRADRLQRAMRLLAQADPTLDRHDIADLDALESVPFVKLSSGHKIILLALTALVRYCEEGTLVLIDEPESHLHPPLLSAFTRAISELVTDRNGLCVVATHSPVVLQEIPQACAWILRRYGDQVRVLHPSVNTFGESVDILTREVFGLELRRSGYYTLLERAANEHGRYADALAEFNDELGSEARLILRTLMSEPEGAAR